MKRIKINKQKGIFNVFVLFFIVLLFFSFSVLLKVYLSAKEILDMHFYAKKVYYLALSGINISDEYLPQIPQYNLPLTEEKVFIYNNLNKALKVSNNLEGEIYLLRATDGRLFSAAIVNNNCRTILKKKNNILTQL
jgi:hypothetical protein